MFPDGPVAPVSVLELVGSVVGAAGKGLVYLALGAGRGVNLLQLRDGKGRLRRIRTGESWIKIRKLRLPLPQLFNNQAHLQAPVAQVDVADDAVSEVTGDALDALADDGGAEMAHVQRLCHVGPAVVHHNGLGLRLRLQAEAGSLGHLRHIVPKISGVQRQIQKAGFHSLNPCKHGLALQLRRHGLGQLQRRAVGLLGRRHGAVALVFTQIRAVGHGHFAETCLQSRRLKGLGHPPGNEIDQLLHIRTSFSAMFFLPAAFRSGSIVILIIPKFFPGVKH